MATKAQLLAELELLKQQMAERDDTSAREAVSETVATAEIAEPETNGDPKSYLTKLLESQGIDQGEIDALWAQMSGELSEMTREKPLLTVAAAFGLGFVAGRMSK